mgnify:FL=1
MKIFLAILLLVGALVVVLLLVGPEQLWRRLNQIEPLQLQDWPGRPTPNWALACPDMPPDERYCRAAVPTHTSPVVAADADELFQWFASHIQAGGEAGVPAKSRNASLVTVTARNDAARKIRFEVLSPRLSFPDIIDLEVFPTGQDRAGFALLSQSLLGSSDLGVNARRIEHYLKDVSAEFDRS